MTRIAALYDIHGNLPALEAVLDAVRAARVDHVVVGGDVLPGPMPCEALDTLFALGIPTTFIAGNGEVAVLAERAGADSGVPAQYRGVIQWVASVISDGHARRIETWPKTARLGDILFCHATPRSENEIFVRTTPEERLVPIFAAAGAPTVVCGHTHMPFDRAIGGVRVVNAGSVGMPFGGPGAYWLLIEQDLEPRRSSYDLDEAAQRIRATAYPAAHTFAEQHVLHPPAEALMLETYSRAEIK